jgi:hypothetical protein
MALLGFFSHEGTKDTKGFGGAAPAASRGSHVAGQPLFLEALLQPHVAGRMSRVNLSCCDHTVARNRESKSNARGFWNRQGTKNAKVFGGRVSAALRAELTFRS